MKIVFFVAGMLFACFGVAGNWKHRTGVEILGQYRDLNATAFSNRDTIFDLYQRTHVDFEFKKKKWFAELSPEIRLLFSPGVGENFPDFATVEPRKRFLGRSLLHRSSAWEAYFQPDKLNVRYAFSEGEIYVGRRALSLGVLNYLPVWNKISKLSVVASGSPFIDHPDMAGGSWQSGPWSLRGFSGRSGDDETTDFTLAEFKYTFVGFETQAIVGQLFERSVWGVAATGDFFESTFKIEYLTAAEKVLLKSQNQLGLAAERAFGDRWYGVLEYLYLDQGRNNKNNLELVPADALQPFLSKHVAYASLRFSQNAFWNYELGCLLSVTDASRYWLGQVQYLVNDESSAKLAVKYPDGSWGSEFSAKRFGLSQGNTIGAPTIVQLGFETFF